MTFLSFGPISNLKSSSKTVFRLIKGNQQFSQAVQTSPGQDMLQITCYCPSKAGRIYISDYKQNYLHVKQYRLWSGVLIESSWIEIEVFISNLH